MSELYKYLQHYVVVENHRHSMTRVGMGLTLVAAVTDLHDISVPKSEDESVGAQFLIQERLGGYKPNMLVMASETTEVEISALDDIGLVYIYDIMIDRTKKVKKLLSKQWN
jgi:hypothetical protein